MKTGTTKPAPYGRKKYSTIDEYHADFPVEVRAKLDQLRQLIRKLAPEAFETISYNIPTFKGNKNLVHYAAYKEHIGFYPTSSPLVIFKDELKGYKTSRGAIQFRLDKPLPQALIKKIVKYRVLEDAAKTTPPPA